MSRFNSYPSDCDSPPRNLTVHSYHHNYQSISNLGNGSFGTVELVKVKFQKLDLLMSHADKQGTLLYPLEDSKINNSNLVAIKTMKKKLPLLQDYSKVKEVKFILTVPSHPCLVQIYEIFIDDLNYQLHISMEALNQNLYQLIRSRRNMKFSPITLKSILAQLLCALKHIHNNQYFHRDVKPENILIIPTLHFYGSKDLVPPYRKNDNFIVKLGDYGLARHVSNLRTYTAYVSTRWYRSPEILLRQKWYSCPIDIWAFGAVAAEIVNFAPLFPGSNELDQIWRILKALGSPMIPESSSLNSNYIIPLGGYWSEASHLANKLGVDLPMEPGTSIAEIVHSPNDTSVYDVIQACLLWDPLARPDATELGRMSYFKESVQLIDNNFEKESAAFGSSSNNKCSEMIPNSPSRKKLLGARHGGVDMTLNNSETPDIENSYENYFQEYFSQIAKDDGSSHVNENDGYYAWYNYGEDFRNDKSREPRNSIALNLQQMNLENENEKKGSLTTLSLESEDVMNL
ncbi:IME2 [Candida oxycetoniae]|uniref:IME2 n=1 Tax=Candida oxycetoniae TaxID=497107 RepID=A0AAI9SVV5_9ASCO|nr:IME2 [Candida oxycetoniae]KAI3403799.1 IME2 [Candida oxycetoniae]